MSLTTQHSGFTSIVAVGLRGEIGVRNALPWVLKSDLRFFKRTTLGNVIVMGRKTYDSIGGCLKGRENIVLSHRASLFPDHKGCHQAHSVDETLFLADKYPKSKTYVIGGAQTYAEFAPFVDRYLFTVVDAKFPDADAFFNEALIPDLDAWARDEVIVDRLDDESADQFSFKTFELKHPDPTAVESARREAIARYADRNHFLKRKSVKHHYKLSGNLDQALRLA